VVPTIDVQLLPGDVIPIRGKEGGRLGDFLGRRETPQRNLGLDLAAISSGMASTISVEVEPGAMALAVMLNFAISRASVLVKAISHQQ
jgi:hypothetical protein